MARTVTLSQLRTDVQTKGDFGGATVRHTPTQITRLINQSIQSFRERISDEGSQHYLVSSTGTLGVGVTGDYQFYQLDLSSLSPALVRTYGIDVTIDGEVVSLEHVPFEQRSKYGSRQNGRPVAWAHFRTDQVAIMPPSSGAHTYVVWYLPKLADLSADGDTFDGVAGWEDFIVWDVVCQLIARDQFPQAYQIAEQRRQEVWQNVIRGATKVTQAGGAHTGRDSFGTKLTYFLGSRRPTTAAAGGPVTPTQDSITVGHLAHFTGPAVIGVPSGTTDPIYWHTASLTSYLPVFTLLSRGLVPPPGSSANLFLRDDGTWAAAGGAGSSAGPSGAIQFQGGTGFAGASGFRIHGNSPSLVAHLDGSLRVTGGQVEVGSGTVRVSASGVDVGGGAVINVGTLVASAIAAPAFTDTTAGLAPLSGGGTSNFLRADGAWATPPAGGGGGPTMLAGGGSGAIQFNSGSGFGGSTGLHVLGAYPSLAVRLIGDLRIPTGGIYVGTGTVAITPTGINMGGNRIFSGIPFSADYMGFVPASAGGSTNFLRADGAWDVPPGTGGGGGPTMLAAGGPGSVQYNGGSGFAAQSGISILTSPNLGLAFGNVNELTANGIAGTIRNATGMTITSLTPSGDQQTLFGFTSLNPSGTLQIGAPSGNISSQRNDVATGGFYHWRVGGSSGTTARLTATGADFTKFHLAARSITVFSGIPNSELSPMASGTVKGQMGADGIAQDIPLQSLTTALYHFDSTNRGVVPGSGGGTTNFLRADGTWEVPPGTGGDASPGGDTQFVQYRDGAGGFGGASGVRIVASGQALQIGHASGPPTVGSIRFGANAQHSIVGKAADLSSQSLWIYSPSGTVAETTGGPTLSVITYGSGSGTIALHRFQTAPSGSVEFELGPSGANSLRFMPTGVDFLGFPLAVKGLRVSSGIPNTELSPMASGTVKAQLAADSIPKDVPIATLFAHYPTFTSVVHGAVPASGGGTTNYLRADGTWDAPPGTAGNPGGPPGAVQFKNSISAFDGASGISIVGSGAASTQGGGGAALVFGDSTASGPAPGGGLGSIRGPGEFSIFGLNASGVNVRILRESATGLSGVATQAVIQYGTVTANRLHRQHANVGTGGMFSWQIGGTEGTGTIAQLTPTGMDILPFHLAAKGLTVTEGITNANLASMASGTIKGQLGPAGTPNDVAVATLHAFAPTFTATNPGTVPESGGGTTNYLRADGTWTAPSGAHQFPNAGGVTNVQMATMSTGTVKANLSGTNSPSDVPIATLLAFAPTFTSTRMGVVPASGGGTDNFLRADGTWTAPSGAHQFPPAAGATNAQLANMSTGTVKGNLAGTNAPADVPFATFMAFAPTFTSVRMGVVPASGGGSTNFLRADGTWDVPPGAAASPGAQLGAVQFNNGVGFGGASGVNIVASGAALAFGVPSFLPGAGDIRIASGFQVGYRSASLADHRLLEWTPGASGTLKIGSPSGGHGTTRYETAQTGAAHEWAFGGQTGSTARLASTGLDLSGFHIKAKSIDVDHLNGLPQTANALSRGLDIGNSSGLPSGLSLYLPRGAGSGANRYIIPSGAVGTGTQSDPRFVTLSPTGGKGGAVMRVERVNAGGWPFEIRTPTGTVLHSMPSGAKSWADFMFEKPSGAVFQLAGHADMY